MRCFVPRALVSRGVPRALALCLTAACAWSGAAFAFDVRPARVCAACHGQIRKDWQSSSMANSWKNPVFQAFLADAKGTLGDAVQVACIACHAPMASVTGDLKFEAPISEEGVTCNFCHNVSAVDPSPNPASYSFDASDPNLMRGPYADSDPGTAHGAAFSEVHTKGEFCAACHEHADPASGVTIDATYTRWKGSKAAAAGKQCQDCHMPPYAGQASPLISKMKREKVNAHTFAGAHAAGGLDSVASIEAVVEGGRLKLTVGNHRAGHALPGGGGGMRSIALAVIFIDGVGATLSTVPVQSYGTEFADPKGKSPVPKWLAKKVARLNEIPPDGSKEEWCDVPAKAKKAEATLTYHFIHPAYLATLNQRQVDLSRHQPVILARKAVPLP